MQPIAVSTLFLTGFALNLVAMGFLLTSWRPDRTYPGLRHWALAAALTTVNAPLIAARPVLPLALSAIAGTGLNVAGHALVLVGLYRFTGSGPAIGRAAALALAAVLAAFLALVWVWPSVGGRVVLYSACAGWFSARAAWHCLRRLGRDLGSPAEFVAALLGALALGHGARLAAAALTLGRADLGLFERATVESALLLVTVVGWAAVLFALPTLQARRLLLDLERSNAHVRKLEGILPICMHCKRIRDAGDSWQALEQYIGERSEAEFSHGLCPDCASRYYPPSERS